MTPKQKAKELYNKYFLLHESTIDENGVWVVVALNKGLAKKCALIAVDETLLLCFNKNEIALNYWKEVKKEIELL